VCFAPLLLLLVRRLSRGPSKHSQTGDDEVTETYCFGKMCGSDLSEPGDRRDVVFRIKSVRFPESPFTARHRIPPIPWERATARPQVFPGSRGVYGSQFRRQTDVHCGTDLEVAQNQAHGQVTPN
jgi:hypothetical protein